MKVVVFSDTHGQHGFIDKMPKGDVLIFCGDLTMDGAYQEVTSFDDWIGRQNYKHKIVIGGNHDKTALKLRSLIKNAIYLENSGIELYGINIWGSPYTPWDFGMEKWWFAGKRRGVSMNTVWEHIPENTDILVTHGPPKNILDKTIHGDFVGCEMLVGQLDRLKNLKYNVFGHIHEAHGITRRNGVTFINSSILDENYHLKFKPEVFEI